jgi:hypothetical protein
MSNFKPGDKVRLRSVVDCPINDQRLAVAHGVTYTVEYVEPEIHYGSEKQRLFLKDLPTYFFGSRFEIVEAAEDRELAAIDGMVKALTGLDAEAARRVLSYGYKRFAN